jgi:agmatine deiminase
MTLKRAGDSSGTEELVLMVASPAKKSPVPFDMGYRMPAEWHKHDATWLSWPKDPVTFPGDSVKKVEQTYVQMMEALRRGERVDLLVDDQETQDAVCGMMGGQKPNVVIHKIRTIDVWMRDYGPIFVKGKSLAATKWTFNAWGDKYEELKYDDKAGMQVAECVGVPTFKSGIVLEGGSIDVNGLGSCLTTKQCLLNKNRNPKLSKEDIEGYLHDYLGITHVVWLDNGIAGDDTDGHVDDIARFVNPNTVICMVEKDKNDENYSALQSNFKQLTAAKDQSGNPLNVLPIQMPGRVDLADARLPASYANFYIANSVVLVPVFNDPNDRQALEVLRSAFPQKKVIGIDCRALVQGLGAIHCVTQQQPSA